MYYILIFHKLSKREKWKTPVFEVIQSPLSSPPVSLAKSWSLAISLNKIFILKILVLEITSRMIFLIFLFIRYDTAIIQLLFWKNFLISLLLQAPNEVSQSNIFLVFFFYIWSSKVNSIFIIIRICFLFNKFNINWFLLFFIVSSKLLLLFLIKALATDLPVAKIFMEYTWFRVF